jgi:uncharacterized protein YjdB
MKKIYLLLSWTMLLMLIVVTSQAQISVTATGGTTSATYTTLNAAINAINAGTHTGVIKISVTGNTTEPAASTLNQTGLGGASYSRISIKPAGATTPTIQGNILTSVLFILGSNVTIDGSNSPGGATRDLTIMNTNATSDAVIRFGSPTTTLGASNDTVMNCVVTNASSSGTGGCIISGSGTTAFAAGEAPNSNNLIQNNALSGSQNGFASYGPGPASLDAGWVISNNTCSNLGFDGITVYNASNLTISGNNISNVSINGNSAVSGILLSYTISGANIFNNKISAISNTYFLADPAAEGMYFDLLSTASNINVYDNFITGISSYGSSTIADNGHGIYLDYGGGLNIYHNTIALNVNQTTPQTTAAICINPYAAGVTPAGSVNLKDNILVNTETSGTRYAIYSTAPNTVFGSIDYNDYYSTPALGFIGGTVRTTLANIQTGFGSNLNSITYNPTFVSTTDLHLQLIAANNALAVGTPIATVTTDIDGGLRSAIKPTIGAHELPFIKYTPLANTCSNVDITLDSVTVSAGIGYVISGATVPQIYFKKNAGPWFHASGTMFSGSSATGLWSFVIPAATMGGVLGGDIISYYVVAQTTTTGTVFGSPSAGLVATNVNTVTTPPTTPNTYTVNAVSLGSLSTSQSYCFTTLPSSVSYAYTGAPGTPNQYKLVWSPAGPVDVPSFTTLPASPIAVSTPASLAAGTYTGTLNIQNTTTTCSTSYTLTLIVKPAPGAITGGLAVCAGGTTTLGNSVAGGTWSIAPATVATINALGVVSPFGAGTATVVYTLSSGCAASAIVTVGTPPAAITGSSVVCQGNTISLADATPGGTWSSSNATKATVSSTGVVTGISGGTVTISYTTGNCPPQTKALTVNPGPGPINGTLEICMGTGTTLTDTTAGGTWSSSTTSVATIGTNGVVTSVSPGTSTITYTRPSNGCNALAVLTVDAVPGAITPNVICAGTPTALSSTLAGGTWLSSNTVVATIGSSSGIINGIIHGTSTITYKVALCSVTQVVTVNLTPVPIIGAGTVCTGRTLSLSNGISGGAWTTSDATVASVATATPVVGLVTGVGPGTAMITYTTVSCPSVSAMVSVNQSPAIITGLTNLCSGSTTTLSDATPGGTWTSSNPAAPITSGGIVTGLGLGITTNISYTIPNGCYQVAPIVVDSLPAPITGHDSTCQFWTDTLFDVTPGGLWSSSNGTIASIEATTGLITGVTPGTVTITYTRVSGCYRTKGFKVRTPLPASVTIQQIPDTIICAGTSVTFKAHWTNGGTPGFQWNKFTLPVPGQTDSIFTYIPTHGDFISVYMTVNGLCAAPNPSYASVYMDIYPNNVVPVVTITSTAPTTGAAYLGETVTFYTDVTYGGTAPTFQWYMNDIAIPGATNSTYTTEIYRTAYYTCKVTSNAPCSATTVGVSNAIEVTSPVGVSTLNVGTSDFNLFPNPNTGSFSLKGTITNGTDKELTIEVSNMLGQVVYTGATTPRNGQVDYQVKLAGDMAAGNYIIRISSDEVNQNFHFVLGK